MSSFPIATVASWTYRDIGAPPPSSPPVEFAPEGTLQLAPPGIPEAEVTLRIKAAVQEAKEALDVSASAQQKERERRIVAALQEFAKQRNAYFRQVEAEVVNLTLAVVRKILKREASVDPTLLLGLVRIVLDDLSADSPVHLRLPPADLPSWKRVELPLSSTFLVTLVEDPGLETGDAIIETKVGRANIGFEAQLKQVEQGFLDLLAHRPE